MTVPDRLVLVTLPEPVLQTLSEFEQAFGASLRLIVPPLEPGTASEVVYESEAFDVDPSDGSNARRPIAAMEGPSLELQIASPNGDADAIAAVLAPVLERTLETAREIQFFTYELSERFEEINLLYSISETLGATLDLVDGARVILSDVSDVMGAKRGSLWVYEADDDRLYLCAEVGDEGRAGPLSLDDPDAVTSMVFRGGQAIIASRGPTGAERDAGDEGDSFLSVPIRYAPASGESRTVGVVNLIGRQDGGRFSAAHQKLLAAIASQIGAALENHRLVELSLSKERMAKEMELAHDLQMKLLPSAQDFEGAQVAARVEPADSVGGDFYHLLRLNDGRVGVMVGDVSGHGFPAALIMTLTMSAATIYAAEFDSPADVLEHLDLSLRDELESTEMYLTLFYGVLDVQRGRLTYANAGHPYAFALRSEGSSERLGALDPPLGLAEEGRYGERQVTWGADDLLLLFTDGLPQALLGMNVTEGEERLVAEAVALRGRTPHDIVSALFALASGFDPSVPSDDRTAIVLRA